MKKRVDTGPVIKRDENNQLDHGDADAQLRTLQERLITEERSHQKEMSFRNARGDKRDIVMKIIIMQRNSVNGKVVLGDDATKGFEAGEDPRDPYKYKIFEWIDGEINATSMPMSHVNTGRWIMGCFKAATNYLARMGAIHVRS